MMSTRPFLLCLALLSACGAMDVGGGTLDDDDDDSADAGAGDADADSDADGDADADVDEGESSSLTCGDDTDNDGDGLFDCSDPQCANLVTCCERTGTTLVPETFDSSLDLATWKRFGDGATDVHESGLFPAGDEQYESGVVSTESYPLAGLIELSFRGSLPCVDCAELIGVALTARNDYAESSSVEPLAGLVLDGSGPQLQMMLVVNGAVEARQSVADSFFDMVLAVHPDGTVQATDAQDMGLNLQGSSTLDPSVTDAYIAIFGRGGEAGSIEEIKLTSRACDSPSAVSRPGPDPIFAGGMLGFAPSAVRAPSVSTVPDDPQLEMLFAAVASDGTSSIGRAVSVNRGVTWVAEPADTPVLSRDDVRVGYASPDEPALLVLGMTDRVAAVSVAPSGDASRRALLVYTSADGLTWQPTTPDPITDEDCWALRHPALLQHPTLPHTTLYFTCEDPSGYGSIRSATSIDLATWTVDPLPVLERDEADDREIDGVSSPSVLLDGDVWQLWYEARSGVRRVLRFAASPTGSDWERFDGTVLSPGPIGAWDSLQVGDPSAVQTSASELRIFYTGLGAAGQGFGVVTHALPLEP